MQLLAYIQTLNAQEKQAFADACGVRVRHFYALARSEKEPSFQLVQRIERNSEGMVDRYDWPDYG